MSNPPEIVEVNLDHEQMARDMEAVNALALENSQAAENAKAIAKQLGYEEHLTIGALEDGIRFYQNRTIEACLELGKRLLLLKEITRRGEFHQRIDFLGISDRTARRFMSSTLKFSKRTSMSVLNAAGTPTKMIELVIFDDDELDALENGETVRGLTLDAIEKMTVSELKQALREEKANNEAQARLLSEKNDKIDRLTTQSIKKQKVAPTDWPYEFTGYIAQAKEAHRAIHVKLGALDIIRESAMQLEAKEGEEPGLEKAREMLAAELVHIHNACLDYVAAIGMSFDKTLGAYSEARIKLISEWTGE